MDALYNAAKPRVVAIGGPTATGKTALSVALAKRFGGEIIQGAPLHPLASARRKALVTRMARVGALRLTLLADPELNLERNWNE